MTKNYKTFYTKNRHQALKNIGLGSGIWKKPIPNPGSATLQRGRVVRSLKSCKTSNLLPAVLWIRDILSRIQIRGSIPLVYGSVYGYCFFCQRLTRCQQKISFSQLFLLYFFEGTFKNRKSKRSHINDKIIGSKFFLTFFASCWKDPDPYNNDGSGSRRPENVRILGIHDTGYLVPIAVSSILCSTSPGYTSRQFFLNQLGTVRYKMLWKKVKGGGV